MRWIAFVVSLLAHVVVEADLLDQTAAHLLAQSQLAHPDAVVSVSMQPMDPRLRLPTCDAPEFGIQSNTLVGRVGVSARCREPRMWTLFMTGNVRVEKTIVVSTRPLARGSILTRQDLALQETDITRLRPGYLTNLDHAVGKQSKRPLHTGDVVYDRLLTPAIIVKKGDKVSVQANTGQVRVSVSGTAMQDGVQGQQIKVRNNASKRVVKAWVVQRGLVTTSVL